MVGSCFQAQGNSFFLDKKSASKGGKWCSCSFSVVLLRFGYPNLFYLYLHFFVLFFSLTLYSPSLGVSIATLLLPLPVLEPNLKIKT